MNTQITSEFLRHITPDMCEAFRDGGENTRRALTHGVMSALTCPEGWYANGEYRSEFNGFFPVQVRFTPAHERFHIAVCSPGEMSPDWIMAFIPASGRPFSVLRTLMAFSPDVMEHTLNLIARLDTDGYTDGCILSLLAQEGGA